MHIDRKTVYRALAVLGITVTGALALKSCPPRVDQATLGSEQNNNSNPTETSPAATPTEPQPVRECRTIYMAGQIPSTVYRKVTELGPDPFSLGDITSFEYIFLDEEGNEQIVPGGPFDPNQVALAKKLLFPKVKRGDRVCDSSPVPPVELDPSLPDFYGRG